MFTARTLITGYAWIWIENLILRNWTSEYLNKYSSRCVLINETTLTWNSCKGENPTKFTLGKRLTSPSKQCFESSAQNSPLTYLVLKSSLKSWGLVRSIFKFI